MTTRRRFARTTLTLLFAAALFGVMGAQCVIFPTPVPVPVATTVDLQFINNTPDPVDPGLFIDDIAYLFDPPLAPGDSFDFVADCSVDTTLQTDATLLNAAGPVASDNAPLLSQGFDYACGDTVTFVFTEDALGFFTQVLVNGVVVAP